MKKLAGIFLVALLGGVAAMGINRLLEKEDNRSFEEKQQVAFANYPIIEDGKQLDFTAASELVTPGVVHIISTIENQGRQSQEFNPFDFFGEGFSLPDPGPAQGSGSGVIISEDGYIATNNHVIDGASSIEVVLNDKRKYRADVVGADPQTDLALLKIEEKGLTFIRFGNSDVVRVGEWVLAVGNPFNLTSTVTAGIVSAKGRNINLLRTQDNQYAIENFIQTDAAVNPGNSGGALVNLKGELIGINTAIASRTGSFSGYSFAVPVSIVKKVMDDLLKFGSVQRGYLGIVIRDVDAKLAEEKNISKIEGVYVEGVNENSAASAAGIKEGDVIVKINDVAVSSSSELQEQVSRFHPGDKLNVVVRRKNEEKTIIATLKNRDGKAEMVKEETRNKSIQFEGATFENLSTDERKKLDLKYGVKIGNLVKGAFKDAGIPDGFIITKIDKTPVYTAAELKRLLEGKKGAILVEGLLKNGEEAVFGVRLK